jgi:hypothetical protein
MTTPKYVCDKCGNVLDPNYIVPDHPRVWDENIHTNAFILTIDNGKLNDLRRMSNETSGNEGDDVVHFNIHVAIDQMLSAYKIEKRGWPAYNDDHDNNMR